MRWAVVAALLFAVVAGVQAVHPADPEADATRLSRQLPLEEDVASESRTGWSIAADGDSAVVGNLGACNEWERSLIIFRQCSRTAPSLLRLYHRGEAWELVGVLDPECQGGIVTPMDVEAGVLAVSQPCTQSGTAGGILQSVVRQSGAVRVVRFAADGVVDDALLTPPDLLRAESFGVDVQVESGVVWVVSLGGNGPDGSQQTDLLVPFRLTQGTWRAGLPSPVETDGDLLMDGDQALLSGPGGWAVHHLRNGVWKPTGQLLPPSAPHLTALSGGRIAQANATQVTTYLPGEDGWVVDATLPVPALHPEDVLGEAPAPWSLDATHDHIALGLPGPQRWNDAQGQEAWLLESAARRGWPEAGAVLLWAHQDEGGWVRTQRLAFGYQDGLGAAVALVGDELLAGAPDGDGGTLSTFQSLGFHGITLAHRLPRPPVADFVVEPGPPLSLDPALLRSTAHDPDHDLAWHGWDVGDDGTLDGVGAQLTHAFPRPGTVPVRLTVADEAGLHHSVVHQVEVRNRPPVADFGPLEPRVYRMAERTVFDRSTDPDGEVVAWHWSTSDGRASDEPVPTFLFDRLGTVLVTLTVTDDHGATDTLTRSILVVNHPPVVTIDHTPPGLTSEPVTFTVSVHDPDGVVASWGWMGRDAPGPETNPWTRSWDRPGLKVVQAEAWDDDGDRSVARVALEVGNRPPVASFSLPASVPTGTHVVPTDRSHDPDGSIRTWLWDLGDGRTVTESLPRLSWDVQGEHVVRLVVVDDHGGRSQSVAVPITVDNRPPTARLTSYWDPAAGVHVVHDVSLDPDGQVTAREWRVDGENAGSEPVLRLDGGGTVRVVLWVEDEHGAHDETTTLLMPPEDPPADATGGDEDAGPGLPLIRDTDGEGDRDDAPDAAAWLRLRPGSWTFWPAVAAAALAVLLARRLFRRRDDVA